MYLHFLLLFCPLQRALLLVGRSNCESSKCLQKLYFSTFTHLSSRILLRKKWIFTECRKLYRIDLLACKVNPKLVMLWQKNDPSLYFLNQNMFLLAIVLLGKYLLKLTVSYSASPYRKKIVLVCMYHLTDFYKYIL